jgi:hypothetical protein
MLVRRKDHFKGAYMGSALAEIIERPVSSPEQANSVIKEALTRRGSALGVVVGFSSRGATSTVTASRYEHLEGELEVVGSPDVDVCVALGFTLLLGRWSKCAPNGTDEWLAGAVVGAAALMTDIDLNDAKVVWRQGIKSGERQYEYRQAVLARFSHPARHSRGILEIDHTRLPSYDADGRLRQGVIALQPPPDIGPAIARNLAEAGIETAADFIGMVSDPWRSSQKHYLLRLDGEPVKVRGIGSDKAISLCLWRQRVEAGRVRTYY